MAIGAAFEELGFEESEGVELFVHDGVDGDSDVGSGGVGFLEAVGVVHEDGVIFEGGGIGADEGDGDHVGGILHEDGGIAVVRVVVVRSGREDDIGVPLSDESDDGSAVFEGGGDFAVVDIEDLGGGAEDFGAGFDFASASEGEWSAGLAPVSDVAVGGGDEFDVVSLGGVEGADAADLQFAVIGVRAEAEDAEFAVVWGLIGGGGGG